MATSPRAFLIELYEEYLEEASFLYENRREYLSDPAVSWVDLKDDEDRLEAHVDGLVVGGELALEVCARQAMESDMGECHAAVRVFCRQKRKDLFLSLLEGIEEDFEEKGPAIADALKEEMPDSWKSSLLTFLKSENPHKISMAVEVIGYRRIEAAPQLINLLKLPETSLKKKIIWAMGRLGNKESIAFLSNELYQEDEEIRTTTAITLLRLHDPNIVSLLKQRALTDRWAILPLALSGQIQANDIFKKQLASDYPFVESIRAVGLLGLTDIIPSLIKFLDHPSVASSAAEALMCMTGENPQEEVFLPDEMEEEELFDEEKDALNKGEMPRRLDGEPYGETIERLSQDPTVWNEIWEQIQSKFDSLQRYRHGKPHTKTTLIESLLNPSPSPTYRSLAMEELVIQYDFKEPIEADSPVFNQRSLLAKSLSPTAPSHVL